MQHYDPLQAPDPKEWLALDEAERIALAEDYHRRAGIRLPKVQVHAAIHATVETQAALADETPVRRTLDRLMSEGLDRHDAIHAIGSVLMDLVYDVTNDPDEHADPNAHYFAAVEELTAEDWLRPDGEVTEDEAEHMRILDGLAGTEDGFPAEAIRAARAQRASITPAFIELIETYLAGSAEPFVQSALFFVFHLLGEWREKSAYRPLARLLRQPADEIEGILGDAITETGSRVMAAVFDGDPQPLYDVILDPQADEFVRSAMCEALAILALRDELSRAEVAGFLRRCDSELEPKIECFAWNGWQGAVAMLGLVELEPLVKQAFERGSIEPGWLSFEDFKEDLQAAIEGSDRQRWQRDKRFTLFGDTIEELSSWAAFREKEQDREPHSDGTNLWSLFKPAVNPYKNVGRNDPCPCGSGKKFKKCCLESARDGGDLRRAS